MSAIIFPAGWRIEPLAKQHPRRRFRSGVAEVDDWLATKALQQQTKHLSTTKVLLDDVGEIAGYYTLAISDVNFEDLPNDVVRQLPKRRLPVAILAWMGVARTYQGRGLGTRLLAQALQDCLDASRVFEFVAIVLDCLNDDAKRFYASFNFQEVPGHPYRLFLTRQFLAHILQES